MELSRLDGIFTSVAAFQHSFPSFSTQNGSSPCLLICLHGILKRTQIPPFFPLQMKVGQKHTVTHLLAPTFDILPLSQMPDWHYKSSIQHLLPLSQASARDGDQQQSPPGSAHALHRRLLDFLAKKGPSKVTHQNNGLSQGARSWAA